MINQPDITSVAINDVALRFSGLDYNFSLDGYAGLSQVPDSVKLISRYDSISAAKKPYECVRGRRDIDRKVRKWSDFHNIPCMWVSGMENSGTAAISYAYSHGADLILLAGIDFDDEWKYASGGRVIGNRPRYSQECRNIIDYFLENSMPLVTLDTKSILPMPKASIDDYIKEKKDARN